MNAAPDPTLAWPICTAAVELIAAAEGLSLKAYRCPAGVWTIGRGRTAGVVPGQECTAAQADAWLCEELTALASRVRQLCTSAPSDNELGALVSCAYNIGIDALRKSTILRAHNAGDAQAAARAFSLWDKARVRGVLAPLPGLTARRAAEAALYLTPDAGTPTLRMPQAVAAESSVAASPIAQSGAVAAGTGVIGLVSQAGDQLGSVGTAVQQARAVVVDQLGVPEGMFLPAIGVACGAVALWWRVKQRRAGWC